MLRMCLDIRSFDGDLAVVVVPVASFGMEKLIHRAPRKKRHRHVESCRTRGSDGINPVSEYENRRRQSESDHTGSEKGCTKGGKRRWLFDVTGAKFANDEGQMPQSPKRRQ